MYVYQSYWHDMSSIIVSCIPEACMYPDAKLACIICACLSVIWCLWNMAIHKHGISFRIKRQRNAQAKVLLCGSLQDGEEAESSPGQELHCCWPCTQTMLIIPYWMFCALGVALFVHDEWLQPQTFRVGTFSMDTSSCYMFKNSSSYWGYSTDVGVLG